MSTNRICQRNESYDKQEFKAVERNTFENRQPNQNQQQAECVALAGGVAATVEIGKAYDTDTPH
jgi:hypothetical protein